MTETFVPVPGGRLFVSDEGIQTDPPILLLHAGIADSRAWDATTPHLLAAGYRVIRRDARGFGRTEIEDVPFSHRADVIAVLDAVGIERAVLVGNSLGGMVALDTAIESPTRVAAVVGVGGGLSGFDGGATPDEIAQYEAGEAIEEAWEAGGPGAPTAADIADFDVRFWVDGPGQPTDRVDSAIREYVRTADTDHYAPGRPHGQPIPLTPRAVHRLAALTCPVLAIAGGLDLSEVAATARHLEASAPNARAVIWPDVAHMIGLEQPERLASEIIEFLAPLPRWS